MLVFLTACGVYLREENSCLLIAWYTHIDHKIQNVLMLKNNLS